MAVIKARTIDQLNYHFRSATVQDLKEIVEIWSEGMIKQGYNVDEINRADVSQTFRLQIVMAKDPFSFWVYQMQDGLIAGWCSVLPLLSNPLPTLTDSFSIMSMYIKEEYQGRKIGRQLMEFVINRTRERQKIRYITDIIISGNAFSIKLCHSIGFKSVGYFPPLSDLPPAEWLVYIIQ
jgi:L-amino acid N-acyltransferase YncA